MQTQEKNDELDSREGKAYPVPVKSDLFGEALLRKVAHSIVVSVGEKVCQAVALPCIHLHGNLIFSWWSRMPQRSLCAQTKAFQSPPECVPNRASWREVALGISV